MPLFVELMAPEQTGIGVSLMIASAVDTFERVRARLTLFGLKTWRIDLKVSLAALGKVTVVFDFVRAIIFQASHTLKSTCKGGMTSLSAILTLWDTRIHIGPSDSCNVTADVEASVDKFPGGQAVL